jgi:hypothetical protein
MQTDQRSLETLQDIKKMMERSSRFISLSGWSGVAAGVCALVGAWLAHGHLNEATFFINSRKAQSQVYSGDLSILLNIWVFWIAAGTFAAAFASSFFFTWLKTREQGLPIWGPTSRRLLVNVMIPMIAGGIFLLRAAWLGYISIISSGCLIFYGIALLNGSKYTLGEIRWLGLVQIVLGIISLWFVGHGLIFWALGFGVMHIVYGLVMWWKYERIKDN